MFVSGNVRSELLLLFWGLWQQRCCGKRIFVQWQSLTCWLLCFCRWTWGYSEENVHQVDQLTAKQGRPNIVPPFSCFTFRVSFGCEHVWVSGLSAWTKPLVCQLHSQCVTPNSDLLPSVSPSLPFPGPSSSQGAIPSMDAGSFTGWRQQIQWLFFSCLTLWLQCWPRLWNENDPVLVLSAAFCKTSAGNWTKQGLFFCQEQKLADEF